MAGFKPIKSQAGAGSEGKLFTYEVAAAHATLLSPGDVVRITGTAGAATGVPQADAATATQSITGVLDSVDFILSGENLTETGLPASTAGTIKVNVDPQMLYEVEVANGPLVVANVGLNADIVATAASKSGGLTVSNMKLNATGVATTQTLPFRIVALLEDSAGVLGNKALVRPNNMTSGDGATGV
ncbi:MAG: hypothetical protein Unbinned6354contig1000_18 [Prokaryotic dsDNA virus sp.]|mgnify:CR=1 FL=1|nr:hypothetical protein [Cytophagaceae bacterium]QDP54315.1 MAG: hypothetical protein Unbinned6354contig1000_18 [Prokaryotic dsDNA virus sp.]|tara:strand:+ start:10046 stop:10603 length:558 start_codon:yes stop_codon:yes gene_type:complete